MSVTIKDGSGGNVAQVNSKKQLSVISVSETSTQNAAREGYAYNINTGLITLTSSTASGVIYFKNDEAPINGESDLVIDSIAVGIGNTGTLASLSEIRVIANPTGGTLISAATPVDMKANRNFGSSNSLGTTTYSYKGVEGSTVTGGNQIALFYGGSGRSFFPVDFILPRGSSIAITLDTQTTAGNTPIYIALIVHRKF